MALVGRIHRMLHMCVVCYSVQVFVLQNGYTDLRLQIAVSLAGAQVGYSAVRSTHNRRVVKEGGHKGCVSLSHEILPSK